MSLYSQEIKTSKNTSNHQSGAIELESKQELPIGKQDVTLVTPPDSINDSNFSESPRNYYLKGIEFSYTNDEDHNIDQTKAAPTNDAICSATSLPIDGTCLQDETNSQSGADIFGGCILNGSTSVFYTFTLTGTNDMLSISIDDFDIGDEGRQIYFMLLEGLCTSPTSISTECTSVPASTSSIALDYFNLTAGTTYYLMIASQPGVGNQINNFDICTTEAIAPPLITGPEQDCDGAIPVCDYTYTQANSYTGYGNEQELVVGSTCLYGGESNSVWYVFTPQTTGDMAFIIATAKDYDWALYDLTDIGGCDNVPSSTPVLCNYSGTLGNTGTTIPTNATVPRSEDDLGVPTMDGIPVTAGNDYALLINNYTSDANGYTLTFDISAGTADIADNPPATGSYPTMQSAASDCDANTIIVSMSEYVNCFSIGQSDFLLTNTTTSTSYTAAITFISGTNCSSGDLTNEISINHDGSLPTGQYEIEVNTGATIADKCGNIIQASGTVSFNYITDITVSASASTLCSGETVSIDADGADGTPSLITYTLNPGGLTNTTDGIFSNLAPAISTTYSVSATYGGCTRIASTDVMVESNVYTLIDPTNKTVCSFPVDLSASTTIAGVPCVGCTYEWSTAETITTISVNAEGTYTVTVTSANGCTNFNNPSSTISLASSGLGGSSCDVIYVSPSGTGDGYSKSAPTTLDDAVDNAVCTNTVIKMQVGVYTLTDYQYVPSYITIEGGYDSDFDNKSSDMSGGANSTTIRRTSSADTGFATDCSAFRIDNSAEEFTIQNIRIELPGSTNVAVHTAGSGLTNYGIKLGTTCKDYHIVRCYIDSGIGAAP